MVFTVAVEFLRRLKPKFVNTSFTSYPSLLGCLPDEATLFGERTALELVG